MRKFNFLMAVCCGFALSGSAAFGQAVPDCDCDGTSDASEKATCVTACCAAAALNGFPCVVSPANSSQTQCTTLCAKLDCNTDLTPGTCCDAATGAEITLCDAYACTNDFCSLETKNNDPKDCALATGHGDETVHVPDDGYCGQTKDDWFCLVTPNGVLSPIACGDKDFTCPQTCSLSGFDCDVTDKVCPNVCDGDPTHKTKCKDDSDCNNVTFTNNSCVPQTCDPNPCNDESECDYWICQPSQFSNAAGCDLKFATAGTFCPKEGTPGDVDCSNPDTCDGKGNCLENNENPNTPCAADYACEVTQGNCVPATNACPLVCSNDKYGGVCVTAATCGRCATGGAVCANNAACGFVCSGCATSTHYGDATCTDAFGTACNNGNKGSCVADTCVFGTCGKEACVARECTDDVCGGTKPSDGNGICEHQPIAVDCTTDGKECTDDECSAGSCTHANDDTNDCSDGNLCTDPDACSAGVCVGGGPPDCHESPDNICSSDFCNQCDVRADADGCVNSYADSICGKILCQSRAAHSPGANNYPANGFPGDEDTSGCHDIDSPTKGIDRNGAVLEHSCHVVETYCIDGSIDQTGLSCVFIDGLIGGQPNLKDCPASIEDTTGDGVAINVSKNFPIFRDGVNTDGSFLVDEAGGCTDAAKVGVDKWVKVWSAEMAAPQDECTVAIDLSASAKASTLFGSNKKNEPLFPKKEKHYYEVVCWGELYDHDCSQTQINAGDWSMFVPCWLSSDPACAYADYNNDGVVNQGDFAFIATAWGKDICGGGIVVPCDEQLGCNCSNSANGVVVNEDGTVEEVEMRTPTREELEAFGLQLPPEMVQERVNRVRTGAVKSQR